MFIITFQTLLILDNINLWTFRKFNMGFETSCSYTDQIASFSHICGLISGSRRWKFVCAGHNRRNHKNADNQVDSGDVRTCCMTYVAALPSPIQYRYLIFSIIVSFSLYQSFVCKLLSYS
jgi:hypothetical protein